jgi:Glycosyl transferase family 2
MIDVHIVVKPCERWIRQCLDSLKNEPVNIFFVPHVEGDTARARMEGFGKGCSDFVSFVDPDDVVVPGIFERCMKAMTRECSGVYTDEILIGKDGAYLMDGWSINEEPFYSLGCRRSLMQGVHHLLVLKRSAVEQCLPLKTKRAPEAILIHDLKKIGPLVHLPIVGYKWRIHGENTIFKYTENELDEAVNYIRN